MEIRERNTITVSVIFGEIVMIFFYVFSRFGYRKSERLDVFIEYSTRFKRDEIFLKLLASFQV